MGSLLEFRRPNTPPRAVFALGTRLVERDSTSGRRAVLEIDGVATLCVVAEVPVVGDVIHGPLTAVVKTVRITRDGCVRISACRVVPDLVPEPGSLAVPAPPSEASPPRAC